MLIKIKHSEARYAVEVIRGTTILPGYSGMSLDKAFWEVCERYPEDLILWEEKNVIVNVENLANIFQHHLIMASYPAGQYYIPDVIGYVDQLPFVKPLPGIKYPCWRMSTDAGGIFAKTALCFKPRFNRIRNFGYLINSIAKAGQQNSLFCYSAPGLISQPGEKVDKVTATTKEVFSFVGQHYKKVRLLILFLCMFKYENKFPLWSLIRAMFKRSYFRVDLELPGFQLKRKGRMIHKHTIDVIIPTLNRKSQLKNVLEDLRKQEHLPAKVIIVEQDPDANSCTALDYLESETWPFEIVHHFTHKTGACYARNLALEEVTSNWVFFADDDIRFDKLLLQEGLQAVEKLGFSALNFNTLQPGETTQFQKMKQWGAFASGAALVRSDFTSLNRFSEEFEHGFGEDIDYGMKLRRCGCDIIYHPEMQVTHLKADHGGFRSSGCMTIDQKKGIAPKPSSTMMLLITKHYSKEMRKGYKLNLFLKFYNKQSIKNPFSYYRSMQKRWQLSKNLSDALIQNSNS